MNAFFGIGIISAVIYWILVGGMYWKIYAALVAGYIVLTQLGTWSRHNDLRRRCNIATWSGRG